MAQELSAYSNSILVYAISPIAISLRWRRGFSNCRVGAIVYGVRNSNALPGENGYK